METPLGGLELGMVKFGTIYQHNLNLIFKDLSRV